MRARGVSALAGWVGTVWTLVHFLSNTEPRSSGLAQSLIGNSSFFFFFLIFIYLFILAVQGLSCGTGDL